MSTSPALPFKALVISAGLLDEVLLLMWSEEIIRSAMDHSIATLLFAPRDRAVYSAMGMSPGAFAPIIKRSLMKVVAGLDVVFRPFFWPFKKLLERYLRRTFFELVKSAAFGVDIAEVRQAELEVSIEPRLKHIIDDHGWLVTDDLVRESPRSSGTSAAVRYAFLTDPDKLVERQRSSWLIERMTPLLANKTQKTSATSTPIALDEWTTRLALSLEERLQEIVGLVDLSHSHYYSNQEVIDRIARFIARGEVPPAAR